MLPAGLLVLVSAIVFLPFASRLGFYRDDWYMLWSANMRGANSIIDLFSIDRPFMGYTYALTYRLLGNSPLPWQLYSFVLKTLGAIALYGIMRLIWPEQRRAALAAALIYLVYPGFLGQPNAATKTNQLLSLTAELSSIWLSGLALRSERKTTRGALISAAVLLALLNFLLYEYMIGLEVLRLWVLWLVPQQSAPLKMRDRIRRPHPRRMALCIGHPGVSGLAAGFFQKRSRGYGPILNRTIGSGQASQCLCISWTGIGHGSAGGHGDRMGVPL